MPTASVAISSANKDNTKFVVSDTSDYTGVTVNSTDLTVVFPDNSSVTVDMYSENFGAEGATYNVSATLLGLSGGTLSDGVYSFTLIADTSGGTLTSDTVYFLLDVNAIKCWCDDFELTIDEEKDVEDKIRENRTEVRELIQVAQEKFELFQYSDATEAIQRALYICQNNC